MKFKYLKTITISELKVGDYFSPYLNEKDCILYMFDPLRSNAHDLIRFNSKIVKTGKVYEHSWYSSRIQEMYLFKKIPAEIDDTGMDFL